MDDVFNRDLAKEDAAPEAVLPEAPVDAREAQTVEAEQSEGASTAPGTDKHVPLAALEAERGQRRDWKEKALRYEGELKAFKEAQERQARQPQGQPQEQVPQDPMQAMEQRFVNMTLNVSEKMARKSYGDEVVNKAFEKFQAAVAKNPMLHQQAMASGDPWDFVVQEGQKMVALEEFGTDPKAYREKLKAELMAELQSTSQPAQPAVNLPQSLANARSAATRTASTFTGPTPFANLFPN